MKRLLSMLLFAALAVTQLHAQEGVLLAEKGRSNCCIVSPANASAAHRRAGEELSRYISLAASCPAPAVVQKAEEELIPVHLEILQEDLPDKDSFRLLCSRGGVWIQAANEQALYHGVYRFLKRYAKMRWLVPGVDGEYYSPGTRIAVPFQETTESPAFPFRYLELNCANTNGMMTDTWDWILRNNFVLASAHGHVYTTKAWKPELGEALRIRGCRCRDSKMFGDLITGTRIRPGAKTAVEEMKALFAAHPEYFPLVNGKRVFMRGYEQPCTSNPEVGRGMAEHAVMFSARLADSDGFLSIINDDGTTWCECEACQALDPPDEKSKNYRSTRYWTLLNRIFKDVLDKYPSIQAFGLAYQNFQTVPSGVKIDERINVGLSFNRRCFRHNLDDPQCLTNRQFLEYYRDWGKLPNRTYSREEFHAGVGRNYMPSERALISGFKQYRQLGIDGASICTVPPDGTYRPIYDDTVKLGWFCEWQALYLAGEFLWNPEADYEKLLEEANRLYYGPAWDGGMREFRSLLTKACDETPGCFGWGHGSNPGRVLAKAGLPEKLLALLDEAEKAANGDPRALAHVKRDRHLFQITLLKSTEEFLRSYKELKAFEVSSPVMLDGKPDEAAWNQAEVYSAFIKFKGEKTNAPDEMAALQTFVRVMYDQGNLWVFIEALENNPAGITNQRKPGEAPWGDDSLELFLTHPNFNGKYYHFAWTRNGAFYQAQTIPGSLEADTTIETDVEIKTQVLADRWTAEIKIPVARLGQDCIVGHTWQINVARNRKNLDGKNEQSSLAGGGFHGAFFPLSLAGKKAADISGLKDTRLWKNGNFNDVFKRPNDKWAKGWDLGKEELLARGWSLNTPQPGASFELLKHPGSNDDFFVLLKKGNFYQRHLGEDEAVRCSFRIKGHGKFKIMIFRFDRGKYPKHLGTDILRVLTLNSDEWVTYQMDYLKKAADETAGLVFWNDGDGDLYIDDAYVFGIPAADVKMKKK